MKFLADENIPLEVVSNLVKLGFDIVSVSKLSPGISDEEVLTLAIKQKRVLITFDNDFGKLLFKQKNESNGVIFLRIVPQTTNYVLAMLKKTLVKEIEFETSFSIVESHRLRVIKIEK